MNELRPVYYGYNKKICMPQNKKFQKLCDKVERRTHRMSRTEDERIDYLTYLGVWYAKGWFPSKKGLEAFLRQQKTGQNRADDLASRTVDNHRAEYCRWKVKEAWEEKQK